MEQIPLPEIANSNGDVGVKSKMTRADWWECESGCTNEDAVGMTPPPEDAEPGSGQPISHDNIRNR